MSDELTEHYDPEQFFLFQEGIGIYYERYAIDCGAAGDYMFIIPWEEVLETVWGDDIEVVSGPDLCYHCFSFRGFS